MVHQYDRGFFVLELQYGCRDVTRKRRIEGFLLMAFFSLQSIRFGVAFKLSEVKKDSECEVRVL